MPDQNPQHGRRQNFHRGRRGQDRRGNERRGPAPQAPEQTGRDHVDVEQIMREIRSRISQRHGIELTTQQIQELAARRLEAILDPRTVKPSLLEQIRRSASTPADAPAPSVALYSFEETTLYETHRGLLRFMRRLLNPVLKLFFNPNPLISALNTQAKLNQAAAAREAERERRQTEWNALHYEILQRLVLEVSRTSLEAQQLVTRIEALSAKVEFAERRARSIEGTLHQARPAPRPPSDRDSAPPPPPPAPQPTREAGSEVTTTAPVQPPEGAPGEGSRRRRRRRRGRRPQGFAPEGVGVTTPGGLGMPGSANTSPSESAELAHADESDEDDASPDLGTEAGDEGDTDFSAMAAVATESVIVTESPAPPADAPHAEPAPAVETRVVHEDPSPADAADDPERSRPSGE